MKPPKPTHGGPRPGAGRKPTGRVPVMIRVRPEALKRMKAAAREKKMPLGQWLELRTLVPVHLLSK